MDHGLFAHQIPHFAKSYTVIAWDVPAHGRSRPYTQFSLLHAAADMVAIMDTENIPTAHLVGQSMGGYINQFVARDFSQRVSSVTVIGSSPLQPAYYSRLDLLLLAVTPGLLKLYPYNSLIRTIAQQIAVTESAQEYALATLKSYTKAEISTIMQSVYHGVQGYAHEQPLSVPLLITYGDGDQTGKVQTYSHEWAKNEQRPLHIIPNAAHNANMDNPQAFNLILETFLDQVAS